MTATDTVSAGVLLPTRELAMTGDFSAEPVLDFARRAERLALSSVWVGDSLLARPRLEPLVVLAAVAAVTERVTIGTAALTGALRHPLIGAHQVASLDRTTGGRLVLGLGSGFPVPDTEMEFKAVGVPYRSRAARLDRTVRLWRDIWGSHAGADGPVEAELPGEPGRVAGLARLPTPAQAGGPPMWLAGSDTARVVERVAAHYDGWLPFLPTADAYARAWRRIQAEATACGRPAPAITPGLYATVTVDSDRDRARAELDRYVQQYYGRPLTTMAAIQAYGYGTPAQCGDWLAGYLRAGARQLVIRLGSLTPGRQLERLAGEVLPAMWAAVAAGVPPVRPGA